MKIMKGLIITIVFVILVYWAGFVFLTLSISKWLFVPDDYVLWVTNETCVNIIFLVEGIVIFIVPLCIAGMLKRDKDSFL